MGGSVDYSIRNGGVDTYSYNGIVSWRRCVYARFMM
jgi:hypothetical protein